MNKWNVLSLGAGVQSSTMALMAAHGLIKPMPDLAIFADTGAEPKSVYEWLDKLTQMLPFPVRIIKHKDLSSDSYQIKTSKSGRRRLDLGVPLLTDFRGKAVMLSRQCTKHYKVMPIARAIRQHLAPKRGEVVTQWIGISIDEAHRMKESRVKWITNRWPLIDMLMSRADCLEWLASQGYPEPPKSACYFCPFNSNYKWAKMKRDDPDSFRKAVEWERAVNAARAKTDFIKNPLYVHRTMQPLDQVDFERQDQLKLFTDGFGNECEGMCGV